MCRAVTAKSWKELARSYLNSDWSFYTVTLTYQGHGGRQNNCASSSKQPQAKRNWHLNKNLFRKIGFCQWQFRGRLCIGGLDGIWSAFQTALLTASLTSSLLIVTLGHGWKIKWKSETVAWFIADWHIISNSDGSPVNLWDLILIRFIRAWAPNVLVLYQKYEL